MTFVRFGFLLAGSASAASCGGAKATKGAGYLCAANETCKSDDTVTCNVGEFCGYDDVCKTDINTATAAATDGAAATVLKQKCGTGVTTVYCAAAADVCLVQSADHSFDGVGLSAVGPASELNTQCISPANVRCAHATHAKLDNADATKVTKITYAARDSCTKLKSRNSSKVPCSTYKFTDFKKAKPTSATSTATEWTHTGTACITDCCKITGTEAEVQTACEGETEWCAYDSEKKICENKAIEKSTTLAAKGCLPEATSAANVKASSIGAAVVFVTSILLA